jgi:hypothetical protein
LTLFLTVSLPDLLMVGDLGSDKLHHLLSAHLLAGLPHYPCFRDLPMFLEKKRLGLCSSPSLQFFLDDLTFSSALPALARSIFYFFSAVPHLALLALFLFLLLSLPHRGRTQRQRLRSLGARARDSQAQRAPLEDLSPKTIQNEHETKEPLEKNEP